MTAAQGKTLIFGASGHIGGPLAKYMRYKGRGEELRLVTSSPDKLDQLRAEFPDSEAVVVNYLDADGVAGALDGVESVFVITPDFLDERTAMTNLVRAAERAPALRQIVRLLGDPPNMSLKKVPETIRAFGRGTAIQHLQAREVLDASSLPITYLNIAAYLMDDFVRWSGPIRSQRKLAMPFERRTAWIDPAELGEAAARIILSRDDRHLHQLYNLNNGSDLLTFGEIAEMISDVLQERVTYDGSPEYWREITGQRYIDLFGAGADDYFIEYYAFEQRYQFAFDTSDILSRLLGRTPKTLRAWLEQNRSRLV